MASKGLISFAADGYDYGFRRDAHQLVVWGHKDARAKIDSDSAEEEITGAIVEAIRDRFDELDAYFDRYSIAEEMPLAVEGRIGVIAQLG